MKKILILTILLASVSFAAIGVEARSTGSASFAEQTGPLGQIFNPRWHRRGNNRNNGNVRYEKRIVHKGRKVYEDTYRITYKNGREHVKRISRVRIR